MTYEVQIRHSRPVPYGEGYEHSFERKCLEGDSEEDVYRHIHQSCSDHVACIDAWHHQGVEPFSVDTGEPEFFTEVKRPDRTVSIGEARLG